MAQPIQERLITTAPVEIREIGDGAGARKVIRGYAAVYDSVSQDLGGFVEKLRKGCFDAALAANPQYVYCRVQHEGGTSVIGRTGSGTLRVGSDEKGLWYECDLPDTQAGRDIEVLIRRGDIDKSSFCFSVAKAEDELWNWRTNPPLREVLKCGLHDVAPVSGPAYEATSVDMRSGASAARARAFTLTAELRKAEAAAKLAGLKHALK